jgi:hypothetical protein
MHQLQAIMRSCSRLARRKNKKFKLSIDKCLQRLVIYAPRTAFIGLYNRKDNPTSSTQFICFQSDCSLALVSRRIDAETHTLEQFNIYQMFTNKINIINHFDESEANERIGIDALRSCDLIYFIQVAFHPSPRTSLCHSITQNIQM